jgi:predicted nucleotidyltransferase
MFGLPQNVLKMMHDYFIARPQIIQVFVYGSRAMGRQTPGSDIDLAIITEGDQDLSGSVKADLEELPTPYLFDVIEYRSITHKPLREHIDRVGKLLYKKQS